VLQLNSVQENVKPTSGDVMVPLVVDIRIIPVDGMELIPLILCSFGMNGAVTKNAVVIITIVVTRNLAGTIRINDVVVVTNCGVTMMD
jgi:ribosomal protein S28E/S33